MKTPPRWYGIENSHPAKESAGGLRRRFWQFYRLGNLQHREGYRFFLPMGVCFRLYSLVLANKSLVVWRGRPPLERWSKWWWFTMFFNPARSRRCALYAVESMRYNSLKRRYAYRGVIFRIKTILIRVWLISPKNGSSGSVISRGPPYKDPHVRYPPPGQRIYFAHICDRATFNSLSTRITPNTWSRSCNSPQTRSTDTKWL